jgi:hypothetical protein
MLVREFRSYHRPFDLSPHRYQNLALHNEIRHEEQRRELTQAGNHAAVSQCAQIRRCMHVQQLCLGGFSWRHKLTVSQPMMLLDTAHNLLILFAIRDETTM